MSSLLDARQVARILRVSKRTVYNLMRKGILPKGALIGHSRRWTEDEIKKVVQVSESK